MRYFSVRGSFHRFVTRKRVRRPISRVLSWTIIHLGQMSPSASSNLPGNHAGRMSCRSIRSSIWSCSRWGLPCHYCYQQRGALLPHPFTLTCAYTSGGLLSVALAVDLRPPGITWHLTLWSPDFPHFCKRDCLAISTTILEQ